MMKKIVIVFSLLLIVSSCNLVSREEPLLEDTGPVLLNRIDSIAYFHNCVCDVFKSKYPQTRSYSSFKSLSEVEDLETDYVRPFFADILSCTDEVLSQNGVTMEPLTDDEFNAALNYIYPLIYKLAYSGESIDTIINDLIDIYFDEEQTLAIRACINSDFNLENIKTRSIDDDYLVALYKIGASSKSYWSKIKTRGGINGPAYVSDAVAGALAILFEVSGPAAWAALAISIAWSAAVDMWEPTIPEWTNCD